MAGRVMLRGCGPRHLKASGKGWRQDDATGFVRRADDFIHDVRQGNVAREFADISPGFGTNHPQDFKDLGVLDDPSPIRDAAPLSEPQFFEDVTDQERELALRENRPPRKGY